MLECSGEEGLTLDRSGAAPDLVRDLRLGGLEACMATLLGPIQPTALASALECLEADRDAYPVIRLAEALKEREAPLADAIRVTLGRYQARGLMMLSLPERAADILEDLDACAVRVLSATEQAELRILLARCHWEAGRAGAAFDTLSEAERRWPDDARIVFVRLELLARCDPQAALALLRRLEADPARAASLERRAILRGDVLIDAGLAGEALTRAHARPADDLCSLHALVNAHAEGGDRDGWSGAMTRYLALLSRSASGVCVPVDGSILGAFRREAPPAPPPVTPVARLAVVLYVRNAVLTLNASIASILAQTYEAFRLIIVDDGSTDGSGTIIRAVAAADPRIAVIESPVHLGVFRARNLALQLAAADHYTFHEADDWMHPERLERAMARFDGDPRIVCVYSRWVPIDRRGRLGALPHVYRAASLFARRVLDEAGGFDPVRFGGDTEFEWRLRARYGSAAIAISDDVMTVGLRLAAPPAGRGFESPRNPKVWSAYVEGFLRWHRNTPMLHMPAEADGAPRPFPAPPEETAPPAVEAGVDPFVQAETEAAKRGGRPIVVRWPADPPVGRNWGDKLNASLVTMLAERPVINMRHPRAAELTPIHHVIGSNLGAADDKAVVWGTGFMVSNQPVRVPVGQVHAVRGPLTARRIVPSEGAPGLPMGDPALLLPLFYEPNIEPRYDIGIIQHFREAGTELLPRLPAGLSVRLIDITGDIKAVIDATLSCRRILSSSLHGLILGHAYGLPATWLKISDRPLGDDFKFHDYWASIGHNDVSPIQARNGALIDPGSGISTPDKALADVFALLAACPFIEESRRQALIALAKARAGGRTVLGWHAGLRLASDTPSIPPLGPRDG